MSRASHRQPWFMPLIGTNCLRLTVSIVMILCLALPSTALGRDLIIKRGKRQILGKKAYTYDKVLIEGTLLLNGATILNVKKDFTLTGKIDIDRIPIKNGYPGKKGKSPGENGTMGGHGMNGRNGHSLTLKVKGNIGLYGYLNLSGDDGGDGGEGGVGFAGANSDCGSIPAQKGGDGGHGGNGGHGGHGGNLIIICEGTIKGAPRKGVIDLRGGKGGKGGNAGMAAFGGTGCYKVSNPGAAGKPGDAGLGGTGGQGGKATVFAASIPYKYTIRTEGGNGGEGGQGGNGAHASGMRQAGEHDCGMSVYGSQGSPSGFGGSSGQGGDIYVSLACNLAGLTALASGGRGADSVMGGKPGNNVAIRVNECGPVYTPGYNGLEGKRGVNGGTAGSVTLKALTMTDLYVSVAGGPGGEGAEGCDGGRSIPGDGVPKNSGLGGRGGDGGHAGAGGACRLEYATLKKKVLSVVAQGGGPGKGGYALIWNTTKNAYDKVYASSGIQGKSSKGVINLVNVRRPKLVATLSSDLTTVSPGETFTYFVGVASPYLEQTNFNVFLPLPSWMKVKSIGFSNPRGRKTKNGVEWLVSRIRACEQFVYEVKVQVKPDTGPRTYRNKVQARGLAGRGMVSNTHTLRVAWPHRQVVVSGRVTQGGKPVRGVKMVFQGRGGKTVYTDTLGSYSAKIQTGFTGELIPSYDCLRFSAPFKAFQILKKDAKVDFKAQTGVNIRGVITHQRKGVSRVKVSMAGAGSANTNGAGYYLLSSARCPQSGKITLRKTGYILRPAYKVLKATRQSLNTVNVNLSVHRRSK